MAGSYSRLKYASLLRRKHYLPNFDITIAGESDDNIWDGADDAKMEVTPPEGELYPANGALPPLPQKMSPSQAARLAEVLEFLHRHLMAATDNIACNEDVTQVILGSVDWQRIQIVQMLLARYLRGVAEPDQLGE